MLQEKWRITLLNGLSVSGNGRHFERFRGQSTGELLALLVLKSHRFLTREEIAGTIWPDSATSAGRASLRTALSDLRAVLEPTGTPAGSVLKCDRVTVRLMPESFFCDVLEFKEACALAARSDSQSSSAAAALAARAYAGELLPGSYADWLIDERRVLSLAHSRLLSQLVQLQWSERRFMEAIPHVQALLIESPYSDTVVTLAMETCLKAGSSYDALACYERHKEALRRDLDEEVSAPVEELAIRARAHSSEPPSSAFLTPRVQLSQEHRRRGDVPSLNASASVPTGEMLGVPLLLTRSFGRRRDVCYIAEMAYPDALMDEPLSGRRLLTITGPGGAGKTRLAAEVAVEIAARGIDVCFVSLAEVTKASAMLEEIARILALPQGEPTALLSDLINRLSLRPNLLVLDNFEQLVPPDPIGNTDVNECDARLDTEAPSVVCELLRCAPNLTCLVTSRQILGLTGEQEYTLEPLSIPSKNDAPETIQKSDSVRLFEDRARMALPSFRLTPQNAPSVAGICERLDGLPLSIELAAAWVSTLSTVQILQRVTNGLDLLVGRKRDRHHRHKSLKAALDWSFELLTPQQRKTLTALTVFTAGWDGDAAAAVCGNGDAQEIIASLHDRSLIVSDSSVHRELCVPRYRFLETIRTYAAARLDKNEEIALRRSHLAWFDQLAACAFEHWCTQDEDAWHRRIALDQPNVAAALEFGLTDSETSVRAGMRILTNLGHFWMVRAQYSDIESLFARYLANQHAKKPDVLRRRVCYSAGGLACLRRDYRSAESLYLENVAIARLTHKPVEGQVHLSLGGVAAWKGDHARARTCYKDAHRAYRRSGNMRGVASVFGALGGLYLEEQEYSKALHELAQAVELMQELGNLSGTTHHRKLLGLCYAKAGDFVTAADCLERSIDGYLSLMDLRGLSETFVQLAGSYPADTKTARLLGAASAINKAISASVHSESVRVEVTSAIGDQLFDAEWQTGLGMSVSEAAECALELLREER